MGEGFGWSVSTCDLNGDGFDDLVVGAPTYAPNRFSYNSGRIHVFITNNAKYPFLQRTRYACIFLGVFVEELIFKKKLTFSYACWLITNCRKAMIYIWFGKSNAIRSSIETLEYAFYVKYFVAV